MVKMKKILALSCATTMLFSSTAFAGTVSSELEGGGNSVVENDNSTVPHIDNLVLPTFGDNTYDFTLDPDGLLANYDPITYATGQSVYFDATKTAAKLEFTNVADGTTYGLYVSKKVEDTSLTKLTALLSGKTEAEINAPLVGLDKFYVWVPDTVNEGAGKYEALTPTNLAEVIDITLDGSSQVSAIALNIEGGSKSNLAGDFIWDGKVYTDGYESITAEKAAAEYYTPATTAPVAPASIATGLYIGKTSEVDAGTYTSIAPAALGSSEAQLKYTAAVMQQGGTTDKATIVNKSTFDVGVIAEVTVNDRTGLTFLNSSTIAGDDATASVYMALTDGTNSAAVDNTTGKATAYYVVKGTGDDALTYQAATGTETGTGSHVYKQYLSSSLTYKEVGFQITAKANTNTGAKDAWEEYVESLTTAEGAQTKPSIDVVFKFVEIDDAEVTTTVDDNDTPDVPGDDITTYTADFTGKDASVFTVTPSTNSESGATTAVGAGGWATYAAGERGPRIVNTNISYSKTSGVVLTVDLGAGDLKATGISSVKFGATSADVSYDMTYTYDSATGRLTINSGYMGGATAGDTRYINVAFEGSDSIAELTVTVAN